jgi:hypothetical protein
LDYWPEWVALAVVVAYLVNYVMGSIKNRRIADAWLEACVDKLRDNFALVGVDNKGKWVREAANEFSLYCRQDGG